MFICYITSLEMCMNSQYNNKYVYKNVGSEENVCVKPLSSELLLSLSSYSWCTISLIISLYCSSLWLRGKCT